MALNTQAALDLLLVYFWELVANMYITIRPSTYIHKSKHNQHSWAPFSSNGFWSDHILTKATPNIAAMRATKWLTDAMPAPDGEPLGLGADEEDEAGEELDAPEVAEALDDEPAEPETGTAFVAVGPEGRATPLSFPENGPGSTVAAAPTPLMLGTGAPGSVPFVATAAARKVANEPAPSAGALMALRALSIST